MCKTSALPIALYYHSGSSRQLLTLPRPQFKKNQTSYNKLSQLTKLLQENTELGGFNNRHLFFTVLQDSKFMIILQAFITLICVYTWFSQGESKRCLLLYSYNTNPDHLPKVSFLKSIKLGIMLIHTYSHREIYDHKIQSTYIQYTSHNSL